MSLYETLYTPDGDPMSVQAHLVPKLLLQNGWTRNRPTITPVEPIDDDPSPQQPETSGEAEADSTNDEAEEPSKVPEDTQDEPVARYRRRKKSEADDD